MTTLSKNENKTFRGLSSIFDDLLSNESFNIPKASVGNTTPAVNILENEDTFYLDFALPGIDKKNVKIELDNDLLTVSSAVENSTEKTDGSYTRREFHYARFKRSFVLPDTADNTAINASHKDGVLRIEIPKKEEAKVKPMRTIEIK